VTRASHRGRSGAHPRGGRDGAGAPRRRPTERPRPCNPVLRRCHRSPGCPRRAGSRSRTSAGRSRDARRPTHAPRQQISRAGPEGTARGSPATRRHPHIAIRVARDRLPGPAAGPNALDGAVDPRRTPPPLARDAVGAVRRATDRRSRHPDRDLRRYRRSRGGPGAIAGCRTWRVLRVAPPAAPLRWTLTGPRWTLTGPCVYWPPVGASRRDGGGLSGRPGRDRDGARAVRRASGLTTRIPPRGSVPSQPEEALASR
jgi:hypothetical protein